MKEAIASKEMVQDVLGEQFDPMSEPPETKHSDHKLWPLVRAALCEVYDPEIPVNIYELGLMYDIAMTDADGVTDVAVKMTLTSPNCPVAQEMPAAVKLDHLVLCKAGVDRIAHFRGCLNQTTYIYMP